VRHLSFWHSNVQKAVTFRPAGGMQISRSWQQKKTALSALAAALHELAAAASGIPAPSGHLGKKQASLQVATIQRQLQACGEPAAAALAAAHKLHATSVAASRRIAAESSMYEWDGAAPEHLPFSVVGGTLGLPADELSGLRSQVGGALASDPVAASIDDVAASIAAGVVELHELLGAIQQAGADVTTALHEHASRTRHPSTQEGVAHLGCYGFPLVVCGVPAFATFPFHGRVKGIGLYCFALPQCRPDVQSSSCSILHIFVLRNLQSCWPQHHGARYAACCSQV
jgi:hypothetical protein